jgi:hypothetical protein
MKGWRMTQSNDMIERWRVNARLAIHARGGIQHFMPRGRVKIDRRGPLQRLSDQSTAETNARPVLSPYAAQHGQYEAGNNRSLVNRGGTPIARWRTAKMISDSQMAAIEHCWRIWAAIGRSSGLVMDFNRVKAQGNSDGWSEQQALDDMRRIKGYFPEKWWNIFENVCRFDEPAGSAGSKLCNNRDEHVAAARTVVQFVADVIAMNERLSY